MVNNVKCGNVYENNVIIFCNCQIFIWNIKDIVIDVNFLFLDDIEKLIFNYEVKILLDDFKIIMMKFNYGKFIMQ